MTPETPNSTTTTHASGIVDLVCTGSMTQVVDRLESLLTAKGMHVFARIDQAAAAKSVGQVMRPMVLVIFGDPKTGTPLMVRYPSLAIDLPLKALVWETTEGKVLLSFNSPDYLQKRHVLGTPPFTGIPALLQAAAQTA
jgi:uncharacterized protein (DUF302 family)